MQFEFPVDLTRGDRFSFKKDYPWSDVPTDWEVTRRYSNGVEAKAGKLVACFSLYELRIYGRSQG